MNLYQPREYLPFNYDIMTRDMFIGIGIIAVSALILLAIFPPNKIEISQTIKHQNNVQLTQSSSVMINLPAVDSEGNGVVAKLKVESMPGEGRILTNINQLFFWVDTQFSIRTAEAVAENITGVDLSKIDLIYNIETNASVIEGGSAGAALTIATIAVLQNKALPADVMITGTINPDGTVGPIGGVFAKAKASKDSGARLFLVPAGQGSQVNYVPQNSCEEIGPITFCKTQYEAQKSDISKDIGIEVKEVLNINDALKYFITQ